MHECIRAYGIGKERVMRVPNIIDAGEIQRHDEARPLGLESGERLVVVVSRLENAKGVDTAIRALARIDQRLMVSLGVIGDGPARSDLEVLAEDLGVRDRVRFFGWVKHPAPLIAQATALVHCSFFEGFPNSVLEAMFLDVPVVSSYFGEDSREMSCMGATLGFEPGDVHALAKALEAILEGPVTRKRLVQKASKYRQGHELSVAIKRYEAAIACVVAR
jgi:glycosyltransferase involved in cell wall biosynthesis